VHLGSYVLIKWLHVLSSAVLLGMGLASVVQLWAAHRSGSARAAAVVAGTVLKTGWMVILPLGLLQPVTGLALVIVTRTPIDSSWLVTSYGLYLVAFACWIWALILQTQVRDLAQESAIADTPLRYGYYQAMRTWRLLPWPAFTALGLVFLLMIAKPKLW
jgi:uncharacterized membrane protein